MEIITKFNIIAILPMTCQYVVELVMLETTYS